MFRAILISLCFSVISFTGFSQDSTFLKSAYAGGSIVVTENETWRLERVFISNGELYNIKINTTNFKSVYLAGDTLSAPYYSPEMELLGKNDMIQYQFHFKLIR